jgi:hypothetical protein
VDPSARSDTVGLVLDLVRVELVEFFENGLFDEFGVKGGNTIDSVRETIAR